MRNRFAQLGIAEFSLVGLCAMLIAVISLELVQGPRDVRADRRIASTAGNAQPLVMPRAAINRPPLQQYAEVVKRPLFDASRRPLPREVRKAPVARNELRQLTLTGVVMMPDKNLAILRDNKRRQMIRVEQGGPVGDWSLDKIRVDGVTFRRGTATHEMWLHKEASMAHPESGGRNGNGAGEAGRH